MSDTITIYNDDDTQFNITLTLQNRATPEIGSAAIVRATIVDEDRTILVGPIIVTEIGQPTDNWSERVIHVEIPNTDTAGLAETDCADIEVTIEEDGKQLTWPDKEDQRAGRVVVSSRAAPR